MRRNSKEASQKCVGAWGGDDTHLVIKESFTESDLQGGCCHIHFTKEFYYTSTAVMARGLWLNWQGPEGGFDKGPYYVSGDRKIFLSSFK